MKRALRYGRRLARMAAAAWESYLFAFDMRVI